MKGILALVAVALVLVPAATADAAKRTVPVGFYGVNYSGNVELLSPLAQSALWGKLAEGGAESVRLLFNWEISQQQPHGPIDWSRIDSLVGNSVSHGMTMLPVVEYAPRWAKRFPNKIASPPRGTADYTAFLRACVLRYGPMRADNPNAGTFWKEHPRLPYKPIRMWEPWNEPEIIFHWFRDHKGWQVSDQRDYVALLSASFKTIRAADPGARVVLAALSIDSWKNLKKLYDNTAIEGQFDIAAIQAYAGSPSYLPTLMRDFRAALDQHGDKEVPMFVTEMTWPAAKGIAHPRYTTGYMSGFLTDKNGAAKRLRDAYALLRAMRTEIDLRRVFWYTSVTPYQGQNEYDYSGLLNYQDDRVISYPVYGAYLNSSRAVEGCAKKSSGACR